MGIYLFFFNKKKLNTKQAKLSLASHDKMFQNSLCGISLNIIRITLKSYYSQHKFKIYPIYFLNAH